MKLFDALYLFCEQRRSWSAPLLRVSLASWLLWQGYLHFSADQEPLRVWYLSEALPKGWLQLGFALLSLAGLLFVFGGWCRQVAGVLAAALIIGIVPIPMESRLLASGMALALFFNGAGPLAYDRIRARNCKSNCQLE